MSRPRSTSIESYNKIKDNGLLSKRRWQVYDILFKHGALTASELAIKFRIMYESSAPNQLNIGTRLGELRDCGVASEVRSAICSATGMLVALWDVTSKLPLMPPKQKMTACKHCKGKGKVIEVPIKGTLKEGQITWKQPRLF